MFLAYVYRNAYFGDTSNGGVTAKHGQVVVAEPDEDVSGSGDLPVLRIERRVNFGDVILVPDVRPPNTTHAGPMFGGSFVWSSDSRFRDRVSASPVAVHDRFETWSLNDALSR